MLQTKTEESRFFVTADLRTPDNVPMQKRAMAAAAVFPKDLKRFPPVEEVAAVLDRIASRAFVA
jgi:hypothetical protein